MPQAEIPEGVVNLAHTLVETKHLRAWFHALERLPPSFRETAFSEMAAQMRSAGEDPGLADAVASLANPKMYQSVLETVRRRAMQYAVANVLAGSSTLAEAAPQVLEAVASSGDWAFAAIWVYDEAAGGLCCRHVWHEASKRVKIFAGLSVSMTLAKGKGLPGRVWDSKEPTWVCDVSRDSNFPRALGALEADLHGGFAFPVFSRDEIDGIIELFSHRFVEPDEDLLQMVKAVGSQIGLFISREATERKLSQNLLTTTAKPSQTTDD